MSTATALRDAGMERALDFAGPTWAEEAFAFLLEFCTTHATFVSEDVSDAARARGFEAPNDGRAWGGVYRRAVNRGVIRMAGMGRSRTRASVCPLWVSNLCPRSAA